jgi:hypothetical protein
MNSRSLLLSGRRRLRRVAIAGAAASALSLAMVALPSATPAWAASCPSGYMCTWVNANYSGTQWNFPASASRLNYWWYVGNTPNDKISSIQERTSEFYDGWIGKDCPVGSDYTWIGSGASVPNLANDTWQDGTSLNDSISAWGISGSTPAHGSRTAGGC